MESYPIMLNIQGKSAMVVGGGRIAYRKIKSLLKSGAQVTIVSPKLHEDIVALFVRAVEMDSKKVRTTDLTLMHCSSLRQRTIRAVNELVARSAFPYQLVNVVDNPHLGNYHVPAKLTRGKLTIAVATSGVSPAFAKRIRDELAETYDESYGAYLNEIERMNVHGE